MKGQVDGMTILTFGFLWILLLAAAVLFTLFGILGPGGVLFGMLCGGLWFFIFQRGDRFSAVAILVAVLLLAWFTLRAEPPNMPDRQVRGIVGSALGFLLAVYLGGLVSARRGCR